MIQPAKYVKLRVGTKLGHETEHFITKTDQCPSDQVNTASGLCETYNWGHRPSSTAPATASAWRRPSSGASSWTPPPSSKD